MINLNNDEITNAVVDKVADAFMREDTDLYSAVEQRINKKIDDIFVRSVEPRIQAEIDKALTDCFHREYQKTTAWGEKKGQTTTISKELEKLMGNYWAENVNEKGETSGYGKFTRAEYVMAKVTGEDFSKQMERYIIQSAAALKDGMRVQLRASVDEMLAKLFHVQTAQDRAEGRYK